jgi:hypothetical protein
MRAPNPNEIKKTIIIEKISGGNGNNGATAPKPELSDNIVLVK